MTSTVQPFYWPTVAKLLAQPDGPTEFSEIYKSRTLLGDVVETNGPST